MKKLRHNHTREKESKIPHLKTGGQIFSFNLSRILLTITILQNSQDRFYKGKSLFISLNFSNFVYLSLFRENDSQQLFL